jgi:hypothetical protein
LSLLPKPCFVITRKGREERQDRRIKKEKSQQKVT